jgi:hypothetical protein
MCKQAAVGQDKALYGVVVIRCCHHGMMDGWMDGWMDGKHSMGRSSLPIWTILHVLLLMMEWCFGT